MGTVQTLQLVVGVVVVVGETNTTLQRGDVQLAAHHQGEDQAERETTLHHRSGDFGGNRAGRCGSLDEAHKNMMNRLPKEEVRRPYWRDVGGMATSGHSQWLPALLVAEGTCCCCCCCCVDCDTMTVVAPYWVDAT